MGTKPITTSTYLDLVGVDGYVVTVCRVDAPRGGRHDENSQGRPSSGLGNHRHHLVYFGPRHYQGIIHEYDTNKRKGEKQIKT